ncbi:hypothetical protein RhiirC2_793302 [Rhizophagus irregularis]|uniref:DNA-directed DNA polymerase family B exonuclease domain-containing protein n=1 Tax=Rhizophagus irregularis TaxID=588596 RepID=A0A2N1MFU7_9GLOM|nr:hypothetical protein RhiirC2_793302 [Rhizophagus irregularis]
MHTPTIFDQTDRSGANPIPLGSHLVYFNGTSPDGVPSRNDIVAEYDNRMTAILQRSLSDKQAIHFMPTYVSDEAEYIKGVSSYILRISGTLINGQKAITSLARILFPTLKSLSKFGFEDIHAFPLQGYHTKKKAYIRVSTWNHFDQYNALKAVREVGIHTASDDLTPKYYYRKVAREERLPLSSWAVLSDYSYTLSDNAYLFRVSRHSSLGLGKFPTPQSDESNVFMICMTVHWKDDPNPLKQICLVDVETALDPRWTTIVCGSQTNLLKAFALCWKLLAPDIQIGFNDSQYDWRFIVEKAKKLGILEWMYNQMSLKPSSLEKITKWQYQYNAIKVNDTPFHSKHLNIPGCVAIDV